MIGSDDGFAPTKRQAIIWTKGDLIICVTRPQWVKVMRIVIWFYCLTIYWKENKSSVGKMSTEGNEKVKDIISTWSRSKRRQRHSRCYVYFSTEHPESFPGGQLFDDGALTFRTLSPWSKKEDRDLLRASNYARRWSRKVSDHRKALHAASDDPPRVSCCSIVKLRTYLFLLAIPLLLQGLDQANNKCIFQSSVLIRGIILQSDTGVFPSQRHNY